jgi:hypothetical protein
MITNLGISLTLLGIQIHLNDQGIRLGQNVFITTILTRFHMQVAHAVGTRMDRNGKHDLANHRAQKERGKDSIKHYQAIVRLVMYAALATWRDI